MACAPCQKARNAAMKAASTYRPIDAAKIAVASVAAMAGVTTKEELAATVDKIEQQAVEAENVKRYGAL